VRQPHALAAGFQVSNAPASDAEPVIVFETLGEAALDPRHNEMRPYTWGHDDCCLAKDAVSLLLVGRFEGLRAGDHLLIEGDRDQRDVVRLIADAQVVPAGAVGAPGDDRLTLVRWSGATPLHHEYCLGGAAAPRTRVRGNVVVATHGETVGETLQSPGPAPGSAGGVVPRRRRLALASAPLGHLDAETPGLVSPVAVEGPASAAAAPPAFTARPPRSTSTLRVEVDGEPWEERKSLLGSRADDPVFRVEVDDEGAATLVFGDGVFGRRLPDTATVTATYRVGGGAAGNVAADTLTRPLPAGGRFPWLVSVTNPGAATGGRDPESRDHARRVGPATFQKPLVTVTADDYEAAAQAFTDRQGRRPVQRATAAFRWTGSWLTVELAVDPRGGSTLTPELEAALRDHLEAGRLVGYDLAVTPAVYASIELVVEFCVARGGRASDVQQALRLALSNGELGGGRTGFFHPDNFSFGDHLYLSALFAAVMAVPGVESAQIARLARLHAAEPDRDTATNLRQGFLRVGPGEIVRLDDDRNFPEHGTLVIRPRGEGR
jgi:predicted phage baseplate assembly protein